MILSHADIRQRLLAWSPRERWLALAGLLSVVAYAGYLLIWQPLIDSNIQLQQALDSKRQNYRYLQQVAAKVAALGGEGDVTATDSELPAIVLEQTGSQFQLAASLKRIQPESETRFAVSIERAPFDALVVWLATLTSQHYVQVLTVDLQSHVGQSGLVDGKLVLGFDGR